MQWILQDFEDTRQLADALDRQGIPYSWHKVVPFVGDLLPAPKIDNPKATVLFGSYTLWRYAKAQGLWPGVFRIAPFVHQHAWHPFLLNGADALFLELRDIPANLPDGPDHWFLRPVDDSKEEPGRVRSRSDIIALAQKVCALDPEEIPRGALRHDTALMLTRPARILKEWRIWVVDDQVVSFTRKAPASLTGMKLTMTQKPLPNK
jgi:hypothetical protein